MEYLAPAVFTLDESFDELIAHIADQPDDQVAANQMRQLIATAHEAGDIDFVVRSAMTLGALACLDEHFEPLANEATGLFSDGNHHAHDTDQEPTSKHNAKTCTACKAGKRCGQARRANR